MSLLEQAEQLLDKGIHPIRIADGFEMAAKCAVDHLKEIVDEFEGSTENLEPYIEIAMTSLGSKNHQQVPQANGRNSCKCGICGFRSCFARRELELIKVEGKVGGRLEDTVLLRGVVIDKDFSHPQMPKRLENVKLAIYLSV